MFFKDYCVAFNKPRYCRILGSRYALLTLNARLSTSICLSDDDFC